MKPMKLVFFADGIAEHLKYMADKYAALAQKCRDVGVDQTLYREMSHLCLDLREGFLESSDHVED